MKVGSGACIFGVALVLDGCGSSATSTTATPVKAVNFAYSLTGAKVARCASAKKPIPLPAIFPKEFPFPPGTVLDMTAPGRLKHQVTVEGFVPSKGFASTVNFFRYQVPKQGFKLLHFEVDSPNDSEGTYSGFGEAGIWQLRTIVGCSQAMTFGLSAEPSE